ncbi:MAG: starch synthase [Candidatus Komeilibacteria bacterium CG11_big_fil_rev_8_21_14_0_20_36_20]|uniref:Glycogen synthase n=1 Tax=Candidatus Komeilibacteria bacterium CG11_big_fil_rev_8_21_14_0_20_36_20 TaxID=1974477 RepID=A0A2H0NCK0_9BACT|nr:MAG: starch synthase [Candidatus Komeilibacteria bacterium CG11_big_fil_rev_8_21_14_0_20_36_20]PIR81954.1 MAG: starch synthase [Candidatus Komeilibacteria bacterium CG10_big_fil_rev_8_21_14_0_10_36_65]PJC55486.1 MAG: starch synthase [Candidatus Komeilibacteria bacterium CG_4_9_14_0_2_um_filter_36_13]
MSAKNKLQVLFAGAELAPLVKAGGLGDVMGSLPQALAKLGVTIKVIIPFYGLINKAKYKIRLAKKNISFEIEGGQVHFDLYQTVLPQSRVSVFLIKNKLFNPHKIYLGGRRYLKNRVYSREIGDVERFVFFSKAVVRTVEAMKWSIDIIHCHDWHTALIPTFVDEYSLADKNFYNIKTLFTIHNLANQGVAGLDIVDYANLHQQLTLALMEDYYDCDGRIIDLMKIGILSADFINTVSPTYAQEILTKEYGEDLEKYLQRRKKHLVGILNGLDLGLFNPQKDKFIKKKYSVKNFAVAKSVNKKYLQQRSKLPQRSDIPLFGLVTRLVEQKGLDILLPALENLLADYQLQVVILGTGRPQYEQVLKKLAKKYPEKLKTNLIFDLSLAQQIYAGADFFLMPSSFEPCGLGQMIAMRYGAVPLARQTGGLKDTIINNKTGLLFQKYTVSEMKKILKKAIKIYQHPAKMKKLVVRGMKEDFSWQASAEKYLKLYQKLK